MRFVSAGLLIGSFFLLIACGSSAKAEGAKVESESRLGGGRFQGSWKSLSGSLSQTLGRSGEDVLLTGTLASSNGLVRLRLPGSHGSSTILTAIPGTPLGFSERVTPSSGQIRISLESTSSEGVDLRCEWRPLDPPSAQESP